MSPRKNLTSYTFDHHESLDVKSHVHQYTKIDLSQIKKQYKKINKFHCPCVIISKIDGKFVFKVYLDGIWKLGQLNE